MLSFADVNRRFCSRKLSIRSDAQRSYAIGYLRLKNQDLRPQKLKYIFSILMQ